VGDEPLTVALPEYDVVRSVLRALPARGRWTADERRRWLAAMTAAIDFVITVDGPALADQSTEEQE